MSNRVAGMPFAARFDSNMAENGNARLTRMYADNLSLFFSVSFPCSCAYACVVPVYTYDATTQAQAQENGNHSILLCLCLCLRRCVVRVNRHDASINTSATTRRLCLRRTGLHVAGFLCLCLRRTCKPGLREVVKTTIPEQDPPNHKIDGGLCLHPPSSTSKDGIATPLSSSKK